MRDLILLSGAAVAFVSGGVFMKYSEGLTKPVPSVLMFMFFLAGAAFQSLAMRSAQMGPTYLFVLSLEAIMAFFLGVLIFAEPLTIIRVVAVTIIALGIVLLKT